MVERKRPQLAPICIIQSVTPMVRESWREGKKTCLVTKPHKEITMPVITGYSYSQAYTKKKNQGIGIIIIITYGLKIADIIYRSTDDDRRRRLLGHVSSSPLTRQT